MTEQRNRPTLSRLRLVPLPELAAREMPRPLASCRQRWAELRWGAPHQLTLGAVPEQKSA